MTTDLRPDFWTLPLDDLTKREWEALCDGCGKCCLVKLEDEETGKVHYTDIACRLLDCGTARCGNYPLRKQMVKDCVVITPENIDRIASWMPSTCAYRRLQEGRGLPSWHPLLTGRAESVVEAGHSVANRVVPEYEVEEADFQDHLIDDLAAEDTE
ncbi:MAG: YcgN family cysteine cluster protein [Rubricella sp.]